MKCESKWKRTGEVDMSNLSLSRRCAPLSYNLMTFLHLPEKSFFEIVRLPSPLFPNLSSYPLPGDGKHGYRSIRCLHRESSQPHHSHLAMPANQEVPVRRELQRLSDRRGRSDSSEWYESDGGGEREREEGS